MWAIPLSLIAREPLQNSKKSDFLGRPSTQLGHPATEIRFLYRRSRQVGRSLPLLLLMALAGCQAASQEVPPLQPEIQQNWQLQPGDEVAGHRIMGGLGDISIRLNGADIHAPFEGRVQPFNEDCVMFESPMIPGYLLRLCGLNRPRLGDLQQGEVIGRGELLQLATLRQQPDGRWAMVEPSSQVLERVLQAPPRI